MQSSDDPRVLIIENDDVLRTMLFTVLRHQPLGVDTASNSETALDKTRGCDYAMIIIDLDGRDDAVEFLKQFRRERPQTTSFILGVRTSSDMPLEPGLVSATMTKPLEIDTIADIVRECARVVPRPEDPLPCPQQPENDFRTRLWRNPFAAN